MGSGHEEVDPIKSNPNSHKAIGVVLMLTILVGLGYWLRGSPFSNCRAADCNMGTPNATAAAPKPEGCCPSEGQDAPEQPASESPAENPPGY